MPPVSDAIISSMLTRRVFLLNAPWQKSIHALTDSSGTVDGPSTAPDPL